MSKRIAIIGSGISGLVSAYLLKQRHHITLFEANHYLGGHTNTFNVTVANQTYPIDTGFIVFNQKNYPNFCRLIHQLNVPIKKTEMSFSFQSQRLRLEYNLSSLKNFFANPKNLFKPRFYEMLSDIMRFNRRAREFLAGAQDGNLTLKQFMERDKYGKLFLDAYLKPMIAAIWSAKPQTVVQMPVKFLLKFFDNHGLLDIKNRPQWYVIKNGSSDYVAEISKLLPGQIRLNSPVSLIQRRPNGVMVKTAAQTEIFDAVVIAAHSNEALAMLAEPRQIEIDVLSQIHYQTNQIVLHSDHTLLPSMRSAWASWNYRESDHGLPSVTYYMNRLQNLSAPIDFCVSVNQTDEINPEKIISRFEYAHPVFNQAALKAQQQYAFINGVDRIYFCGAYWGHGFHEDGVNSALAVCKSFGVTL